MALPETGEVIGGLENWRIGGLEDCCPLSLANCSVLVNRLHSQGLAYIVSQEASLGPLTQQGRQSSNRGSCFLRDLPPQGKSSGLPLEEGRNQTAFTNTPCIQDSKPVGPSFR